MASFTTPAKAKLVSQQPQHSAAILLWPGHCLFPFCATLVLNSRLLFQNSLTWSKFVSSRARNCSQIINSHKALDMPESLHVCLQGFFPILSGVLLAPNAYACSLALRIISFNFNTPHSLSFLHRRECWWGEEYCSEERAVSRICQIQKADNTLKMAFQTDLTSTSIHCSHNPAPSVCSCRDWLCQPAGLYSWGLLAQAETEGTQLCATAQYLLLPFCKRTWTSLYSSKDWIPALGGHLGIHHGICTPPC